ncbi:MAG: ATP-dependent DNA helicase, partial [Burkholderiaceae bacterium]
MPDLDIADCFAVDGPLAGALPGYSPRASQIELAQAIGETIDSRGTLVAEAGTGIGKTWAYLVPAMLKGGKVLISTGTRTLQDQLFSRDLPRVRAALTIPVSTALLKGRSNYICHYHLERLEGDERALKSRSEISQLRAIQVFAKSTRTGDRGELGKIPEDAEIWQRVTSTRENCLGQECPHIRDCFVVKARKQAQEADIVVINHALFMADLVLRESGITDLLPDADTIIFDEAHQLPDTATRFLGSNVSTHQLLDFARMTEVAGLAHAREAMNWSEAHKRIETAARELRLAASAVEKMPGRKATFENIPQPDAFDQALATLYEAVDNTSRSLAALGERHPDLATAARAGADIAARLMRWSQPGREGASGAIGQRHS